jgi:hypothetical protein
METRALGLQAPAFFARAMPILSQLLKARTAEREVRSTACRLKAARFPACPATSTAWTSPAARSTRRSSASSIVASFAGTLATLLQPEVRAPARPTSPRPSASKPSGAAAPGLSFSKWTTVFGDARTTIARLDRLTRHRHILETGHDSFRSKTGSAITDKPTKEKTRNLTAA